MSLQRFDHFPKLLEPLISKKEKKFGNQYQRAKDFLSLYDFLLLVNCNNPCHFDMGKFTASNIISKTCDGICNVIWKTYLQLHSSADEWLALAKNFEEQRNSPHVVGALDGKHSPILCPLDTGKLSHNYNGFCSLRLMIVCNSNYCFILIDIGRYVINNKWGSEQK